MVIRRSVMFVALLRKTPMPDVVLPFAPLLVWMMPPELLPPSDVLTPSPLMVKLPLVLTSEMPSLVPALDDTLVRDIANGVARLLLLILTAVPVPELIVPLVVVMVLLLLVASNPVC